jgi:hypothetical protein
MENQTINSNNLLSPDYLRALDWWELFKVAKSLVANIPDKKIHDKLIVIFPLEDGQEYFGSLCNHYRGRLKHEGKFALIEQMCSNSMRRLIIGLST